MMGVVYRVFPDESQKVLINKTFGCVRKVYNFFLNGRNIQYDALGEYFGYNRCCNYLTTYKENNPYLKEVDSTALQSALKHLEYAFQNKIKGLTGDIKFKSRKNPVQSYTSKNNKNTIRFEADGIRLPKIGVLRAKNKLRPHGRILSATVRREDDKFYVSLLFTDNKIKAYEDSDNVIGIDVGIKNTVTTSDGEIYNIPPKVFKLQKQIDKLHKKLSRQKKDGKNYQRTRKRLRKKYKKIHNIIDNFMHHTSSKIIRENQIISIETLNIKNMMQNHKLARNIQTQCWNSLFTKLKYKSEWHNRTLIRINQWYPSTKLCNNCQYKNEEITLKEREWTCPECHQHHDRDVNAAINIKNEGKKVYDELMNRGAPGDSLCYYESIDSSKQETLNIKHCSRKELPVIEL